MSIDFTWKNPSKSLKLWQSHPMDFCIFAGPLQLLAMRQNEEGNVENPRAAAPAALELLVWPTSSNTCQSQLEWRCWCYFFDLTDKHGKPCWFNQKKLMIQSTKMVLGCDLTSQNRD